MLVPLLAAAAAFSHYDVPKLMGGRVERATAESGIPVLLPQKIRSEFDKLYANTLINNIGTYGLTIGARKRCYGQSVCGVANFYGATGVKYKGGSSVKLIRGFRGRYYRSECGANCSFPYIVWRDGNISYSIEYKESTGKANMVRLANSAIRKGPR